MNWSRIWNGTVVLMQVGHQKETIVIKQLLFI